MAATYQNAEIGWREGGIPISARFDDPYFSIQDGLAETHHVFLAGNGLPARLFPGFHIAELGFGTGLNLLALWRAVSALGIEVPLRYTSFEAFPMLPADMLRAHAAFPEVMAQGSTLVSALAEGPRFSIGNIQVEIMYGDARQTLPDWPHVADAWFLDGFSPAKNPEMWEAGLMTEVARHTAPSGTFATYTAAGHVRRALADAGFAVERLPGYGRKRHMTIGRKAV
ncbi:MAG: tRNA (5-methylaminomethyl-2-thiouridine)(34)-methyltransferase MnmD [Paracoccaceae bacterium]